ncbi:3-hydroxyacyl-CoA dehydrogenase [Kribbella orskensis]|uniref:3-hydroxyacyl-CoA dehydrogenase n=1 Tax=Kribbella orskensis TaxID=2512216 RepID=A0ABY2B8K2_9ACTN|nr:MULTISPECIES: 3-hydroxyacyl-CoA dehydrogenase NAD-binding domain-containing protein [Kribbella]TCN31031.1 3-hydroxyacyl-CoA dehydrogenase [Kribbella sp. VKM Ac-2500]TCO11566.1 3-hydroxyacyl-CoA dehydrogenase [Kribbella orskensis]
MSDLQQLIDAAVAIETDEVVTLAPSRDVVLPNKAGTMALITLDNGHDHTKPNTFGPKGLAELNKAIDAALAREDVVAIGVTGKPFILAAGADLTGVPKLTDREQALDLGRIGHGVMRKLQDGGKPSFAFVNGVALGGGLEVALHAQYRTVSVAAGMISTPEVFLGLIPGWGGNFLLPNLIGADKAVKVVVENALNQNKMLSGPEAVKFGIGDVLLDSADFLEQSLLWASKVLTGEVTVERAEIDRGDAWDAAVARGRGFADLKVSGAAPAPYRALDLIAAAKDSDKWDRDSAFAAEDEALADLIMSEELRSGVYSFDLVNKRAKRPAGAPDKSLARPVSKVGVVGAGLMAGQLALLFVRRLEVPVVLTDLDQERVDRGVGYVHGEIDKLLGKSRIRPDKANQLKALVTGSVDRAVFADADFVIEAVFEELQLKKTIFADLEKIVRPDAILATNTSSLSITEMAADLAHPERVVGFHFFNPVAVLPLLEVIRADQTDDASLATAFAVGKTLKKSCVLVKDAPAFVVNRLLTRFLGEVSAAVDEGTPIPAADKALSALGLPMPPFVLLQLVGLPVALHVAETMNCAYPDRFAVSENLAKVVAAGKSSFYVWSAEGKPSVDPEVEALVTVGDKPSTAEELRSRVLAALAEEIRILLDEGVVAEAQDIDLCLLLGAGWPFHLGGITPYLDRSGIAEKVNGKRFLPRGVASLA